MSNIEDLRIKLKELEKQRLDLYGQEAVEKYENSKKLETEEKPKVENKEAQKGLIFGLLSVFGFIFLCGLAFKNSRKGLKKAKEINVGKGQAIAGMVLSIISILMIIGFVAAFYFLPEFRQAFMESFRGGY